MKCGTGAKRGLQAKGFPWSGARFPQERKVNKNGGLIGRSQRCMPRKKSLMVTPVKTNIMRKNAYVKLFFRVQNGRSGGHHFELEGGHH